MKFVVNELRVRNIENNINVILAVFAIVSISQARQLDIIVLSCMVSQVYNSILHMLFIKNIIVSCFEMYRLVHLIYSSNVQFLSDNHHECVHQRKNNDRILEEINDNCYSKIKRSFNYFSLFLNLL